MTGEHEAGIRAEASRSAVLQWSLMKHDFSDPAYQDVLLDLFKPGAGSAPPALAGRDREIDALGDLLRPLSKGEAPPREAVMYGPRGNGKTVLLERFIRQCRAADMRVVDLRPKDIESRADMAALLLHDDQTMPGLLEQIKPDNLRFSVPGIGSASWQNLAPAEKDALRVRHLKGLLAARCQDAPLLVTLDEAHTLDMDLGGTLLNLSEALRKSGAPFLLVMAGTPNLRGHLSGMNATFWSRAEKLAIGRLDTAATREALQRPLEKLSVTFDDEALNRVVTDSQAYPYFIQLWGKELCQALVTTAHTHRITTRIVEQALPAVEFQRRDYYQDRHKEIKKGGLRLAAIAVAGVFSGRDTTIKDDTLEKTLIEAGVAADESGAMSRIEALSDLGYIWNPPGEMHWQPGIPSLMSYILEG